ncbi:MAG: TIR domain-containing protein [Syntrophales bacterium LBB04]|nr:TIR domain-containing protein [Syntrophales bacterium LBB04]
MLPRRSIFISYYHKADQAYYDQFSELFSEIYGVVQDNSLDRIIDSDDTAYVRQSIRENNITGSSCTIVLCSPMTPYRKYVDWEIKATLDKEHGLIGVKLPGLVIVNNGCHKPARLQDNIDSKYAVWTHWEILINGGAEALKKSVEEAIGKPKELIDNTRDMMTRNG